MIIDPPSTTVSLSVTAASQFDTHPSFLSKMQSGPIPSENPPAYESAIVGTSVGTWVPHLLAHEWRLTYTLYYLRSGSRLSPSFCNNTAPPSGKSANPQDAQPKGPELMLTSGPQPPIMYGATTTEATVFYYQDPRTGQRVASLLPPDHPQMVCLQAGEHIPETRYGFLGTLCLHAPVFVDCVWLMFVGLFI
jgi:hypothetical protein